MMRLLILMIIMLYVNVQILNVNYVKINSFLLKNQFFLIEREQIQNYVIYYYQK